MTQVRSPSFRERRLWTQDVARQVRAVVKKSGTLGGFGDLGGLWARAEREGERRRAAQRRENGHPITGGLGVLELNNLRL